MHSVTMISGNGAETKRAGRSKGNMGHSDCAGQVREMVGSLGREEKTFLHGLPFSEDIDRALKNAARRGEKALPSRARISLGSCTYDSKGNITGYQSTTVMNDANPTKYEREHILLNGSLDYVQLKLIVVDIKFRGSGTADNLISASMELARINSKDWLTDVNAANERMLSFLSKHGVSKRSEWLTRNGTLMYRLGIDK